MKHDMKLIGLTGGIATGKSTVSQFIKDHGLALVDADILAREVVGPGTFGLRALVDIFGSEILKKTNEEFELDRLKLAQKLFGDLVCRRVVENIVHPLIQWRAAQEFEVLRAAGHKIVFYDAALIFEKELQHKFDSVIVVHTGREDAGLKIQMERLMARDKISKDTAKRRIDSQMPMTEKISAAHHLIDNSETLKKTEEQVRELLKRLTQA